MSNLSGYVELLVKRMASHPDRAAEMLKTMKATDQEKYLTDAEKEAIKNAKRKIALDKAEVRLMKIVLDGDKPKKKRRKKSTTVKFININPYNGQWRQTQ